MRIRIKRITRIRNSSEESTTNEASDHRKLQLRLSKIYKSINIAEMAASLFPENSNRNATVNSYIKKGPPEVKHLPLFDTSLSLDPKGKEFKRIVTNFVLVVYWMRQSDVNNYQSDRLYFCIEEWIFNSRKVLIIDN